MIPTKEELDKRRDAFAHKEYPGTDSKQSARYVACNVGFDACAEFILERLKPSGVERNEFCSHDAGYESISEAMLAAWDAGSIPKQFKIERVERQLREERAHADLLAEALENIWSGNTSKRNNCADAWLPKQVQYEKIASAVTALHKKHRESKCK